jgi:hypothetical protein
MSNTVETASDIRPFHVDIPDEALEDLRRRIAATNWPEKETVDRGGRLAAWELPQLFAEEIRAAFRSLR